MWNGRKLNSRKRCEKRKSKKGKYLWLTVVYETTFRAEQKCKVTRTKNSSFAPE
jgi:hypothetical protein